MRPFLRPRVQQTFTSCLLAHGSSLSRQTLTHNNLRASRIFPLTARPVVSLAFRSPQNHIPVAAMDKSELTHTQTVAQLAEELNSIGISEVPRQPNTYPELNPVDLYRSHIAELLAPIAGVDTKIVYNALQWTQTLAMGDLVIPVPALRLKGKKPDQLAKELSEKVCPP
jgi:hypothetical protein